MKGKVVALLAFVATGCGLLLSSLTKDTDLISALLIGVIAVFYGIGLLTHHRKIFK